MKNGLTLTFLLTLSFICLANAQNVEIVLLGVTQDGGYPQAHCQKECCARVASSETAKLVTSLGIVDLNTNDYYIIDCTPDFPTQLSTMSNYAIERGTLPKAIFLTHAHIGHYTGLTQLSKEVIDTDMQAVYAMPRMEAFLKENGPWSQLVDDRNIDLKKLKDHQEIKLTENLSVTPIAVPHRDEFSETVGYIIKAAKESLLFIPDIDKWGKWDEDIKTLIKTVDHAFLDGTFYSDGELPGRDMSAIPHPFVEESMQLFKDLSALDRSKIHFIHMNHTNPLLNRKSLAYKSVYLNGYNVASQGLSIYMD